MVMAYEEKFREKVMMFLDKGNTAVKAHEVFGVSRSTMREWEKIRVETGKLEKRSLYRTPSKLCPNKLQAYITENPDSYLREIAEEFNCTEPAVFYALKRMKVTRKKNH